MNKFFPIRIAIAALALALAACATPPRAPDTAAAANLASSAAERDRERQRLSAPPAEASSPDPADEPTLIRGNDRMFAPPKADPAFRASGAPVSLKFEQAPVADLVHAVLGDILKVPYAIDQPVAGTVTLHTQTPERFDAARARLADATVISPDPPPHPRPIVLDRVRFD